MDESSSSSHAALGPLADAVFVGDRGLGVLARPQAPARDARPDPAPNDDENADGDEVETDEITGVETTGHEWDGIRELNNPLPDGGSTRSMHHPVLGGLVGPLPGLAMVNGYTRGPGLGPTGRAREQMAAARLAQAPGPTGSPRRTAGDHGRSRPPAFATAGGQAPSTPTARPATASAAPARASIRRSPTTTGCGAARRARSRTRSPTASATATTRTRRQRDAGLRRRRHADPRADRATSRSMCSALAGREHDAAEARGQPNCSPRTAPPATGRTARATRSSARPTSPTPSGSTAARGSRSQPRSGSRSRA